MRPVTVDPNGPLSLVALRGIDLAEVVTRPLKHHGFFKLARWCGRLAPPGQRCTVELAPDALFSMRTADPYWSRLVSERFDYERATALILHCIADVDYVFIDAGANFGYWSVLATSCRFGAKPTVAIEPVGETFRALEENRQLNGDRFTTLKRALAETAGEEVVMEYPASVVGARAAAGAVGANGPREGLETEIVDSISLDAVIEEHVPPGHPVVLKLDVEGMEIPALRGSSRLYERDWMLIYEDHGNDDSCSTSEFVLGLGASVCFVTETGEVHPIRTLDDVRRFKPWSRLGYNFFAAPPGGAFERRLQEVRDGLATPRDGA